MLQDALKDLQVASDFEKKSFAQDAHKISKFDDLVWIKFLIYPTSIRLILR